MTAKRIPRISETEWEVMRVLWARSPRSANEVIECLQGAGPRRNARTIKTFLTRLVSKGALGYSKEGRSYLYRPLVKEDECVDAASESFLDRVFGGSLKPMLAHFVETRKLSREEVRELKELLEKRKD